VVPLVVRQMAPLNTNSEGAKTRVGERHLPGLTDRGHELRRPNISFKGRRLLGDMRPPVRIHLFQ
jgi:hypothetical protein